MLIIAGVQYGLLGNKLLGLYDHPHRDFNESLQGTFANKNHFAHYALLGIGPALAIVLGLPKSMKVDAVGKVLRHLGTLALIGLMVAVFASESRGAVAALGVATMVGALVAYCVGAIEAKHCLLLSLVVVGSFLGVSAFGYERISARMGGLFSGSVEELDALQSRRLIWSANVEALLASPWVGFGAGTHREVYTYFFSAPSPREFTHAESGYLQIASETGLVGLALLGGFLASIVATVVRGVRRSPSTEVRWMWVAIAFSLSASMSHSAVDFVWYLPGLAAPTLAIVACAVRLEEQDRGLSVSESRHSVNQGSMTRWWPVGLASFGGCFALTWMLGPAAASQNWDSYLRTSISLRQLTQRATVTGTTEDADRLNATIEAGVDRSIDFLRGVIASNPSHSRAHLRLARRLLQIDECQVRSGAEPMGLEQIRDAAINGGFEDYRGRMAWINRVFGERAARLSEARRHALAAIHLCPLHGEAYLVLASLKFLDDNATGQSALVDQALAVRPHDGDVLFEAGYSRWLEGRPEECLDLWRRSIRQPGSHIAKLVSIYASMGSAEGLISDLEPGPAAIGIAINAYQQKGGADEDLAAICHYAASKTKEAELVGEKPKEALAERWRQVSATLRLIGREESAVEAAQHAFHLAPQWFPGRLEMAAALRATDRFDEADSHIRWCLARRPDISYLAVWLQEAAKRRTKVDENRRYRLAESQSVGGSGSHRSEVSAKGSTNPDVTPPRRR